MTVMELTLGIFFDGTSNNINDKPSTITNIAKLYRVYSESDSPMIRKLYIRGVGSEKYREDNDRLGGQSALSQGIDRMFGGAFGSGGHDRIDFILDQAKTILKENPGVTKLTFDVFGFSRGAALARHFINVIRKKPLHKKQSIRFLGLFDTVGSFGLPGNNKDNFDFRIPKNSVKYVYHLVAENELRQNFDLHSIRPNSSIPLNHDDSSCTGNRWAVEILCPGVHSDIGGGYDQLKPGKKKLEHGNRNNRLSRHYLKQMHNRAKACGVPFDDAPAGEFKQQWNYGETLSKSINSLLSEYKKKPELRVKHAVLREAIHSVEVFSDELRGMPKKVNNKRPNQHYKRRKRELDNMRKHGIPLLETIFLQDAFNNNKLRYKKFLSGYKKINKGFIHISHSPINDSIGMDAQITSSLVNTRVWPALESTAYASLIKRAVKRDIFYN
jgi:hypothetical protein